VLITGGIRDTRCPIRQIELYESRLVEHGKQHEMHTFDRGHTARSRAERIDEMRTGNTTVIGSSTVVTCEIESVTGPFPFVDG
jgi:hypothetical protein